MMNVLAAHYLALVERSYDVFQVVFLFHNLLIVLPLMLIATALVRRASRRTLFVAGFLAASPMLLQNVTWTWTKLGAGFYVILGLFLYVRAWRKRDGLRMILAFGALATGMLVHYSAGPYAAFLGFHYLVALVGRERRWRELAAAAAVVTLVLLPWFAWSVAAYGTRTTLGSNTTVAGIGAVSLEQNLARTGTNIVNSIVPHPLRAAGRRYVAEWFQPQKSTLGYVRDYTFLIYQVNAAGALGSVGGLVALYLVYRRCRGAPVRARAEVRFWIAFVVVCFLLGIAVHGAPDDVGLVHICLQPLMLLGVVFVAASVPDLSRWLRGALLAGCAGDFVFGVLLQFAMENRVGTLTVSDGKLFISNTMGLSQVAALSWGAREIYSKHFFGDHFVSLAPAIQVALVLGYAAVLVLMWRRLQSARR
jgi:hypothetical protein